MLRSSVVPAVVAVVLLWLVGACTDGGALGPTADPTPNIASPSPSASAPEALKPERPLVMDRDDAEGAAAAAEYFIELYPYVMATGDAAEFERMSHKACGFCSGTLSDARDIAADGKQYDGGATVATLIQTFERDELTGIFPLDFRVEQASARVVDPSGSQVTTTEAKVGDVRVEMGRLEGEWVVVGIADLPTQ